MYQYLTVWTTGFSLSAMSARYWPFLPGKRWIVLTACIVIIIHIAIHRDVFNKHLVRLIKKNSRVANVRNDLDGKCRALVLGLATP